MNNFLPKLADALYIGESDCEVLDILSTEIKELSGVFYADQIYLKLQEALLLRTDNAFKKKSLKWSRDLQAEFETAGISVDVFFRLKALISLLLKMNRIMADGKSINSLHDLMGLEFVILTPSEKDDPETIRQLYTVTNIILNYFSDSKRSGEEFMLCDASELKDVYPLDELLDEAKRPEILVELEKLNPNCYIPLESGLLPKYRGFVKDYYRQPKFTGYQGLQLVIKTKKGIYFEIQIKTQPAYDYKNDPASPAYHGNYRNEQTNQNDKKVEGNPDVPQFDLSFEPKKVSILGFRSNPNVDRSGIIAPKKWSI